MVASAETTFEIELRSSKACSRAAWWTVMPVIPMGCGDAAVAREFSHIAAPLVLLNLTDTEYEEIPGVMMPGRSVVFDLEFFGRGR